MSLDVLIVSVLFVAVFAAFVKEKFSPDLIAMGAVAVMLAFGILNSREVMGLFSNDENVVRIGSSYLQITGPLYGFYGLGGALFFVTQGVGSNIWTMIANAVRLFGSAAGSLIAIYWLDLGQDGFFLAIAGGFCAYAALATGATLRVKEPAATPA